MLLLWPSPTVRGAAALLAFSPESFFAWVAAGQMLRADREQVDYDQHLFKKPGVKVGTLMNRDWRSSSSPRCPENLAPLLLISHERSPQSYQAESSPTFLPGGVSEHWGPWLELDRLRSAKGGVSGSVRSQGDNLERALGEPSKPEKRGPSYTLALQPAPGGSWLPPGKAEIRISGKGGLDI